MSAQAVVICSDSAVDFNVGIERQLDSFQRSAAFRQGEGLIAGKISPEPALLRFGARISEEGGADVPATWASPR